MLVASPPRCLDLRARPVHPLASCLTSPPLAEAGHAGPVSDSEDSSVKLYLPPVPEMPPAFTEDGAKPDETSKHRNGAALSQSMLCAPLGARIRFADAEDSEFECKCDDLGDAHNGATHTGIDGDSQVPQPNQDSEGSSDYVAPPVCAYATSDASERSRGCDHDEPPDVLFPPVGELVDLARRSCDASLPIFKVLGNPADMEVEDGPLTFHLSGDRLLTTLQKSASKFIRKRWPTVCIRLVAFTDDGIVNVLAAASSTCQVSNLLELLDSSSLLCVVGQQQ